MQDRVATHPNRWKLTPVVGESDVYDFERADEPVVAGTPLDKATFLTDTTAAAIGALTGNTPALPTEALDELAGLLSDVGINEDVAHIEVGSYIGTGTGGSSNPNSLTFTYKPRFVSVIRGASYFGATSQNNNIVWQYGQTSGYQSNHFTPTDNVLSWYSSGTSDRDLKQLNESGTTYYYFAITVN